MSKSGAAQVSPGPDGATAPASNPAEARTLAQIAAAAEDWDAALAVWVQHAHKGNARAQAEIGRCFVNGWGVARDVDLTLKWLLPAVKAGDRLGQSLLADFYFNGEDGLPQRSIAEEWYVRAAKQDDAHADDRQPNAMQCALQAAEQGVAAAMTRIGLLYSNALGVERDVVVAAHWWRKAALLGDGDGQAMLGAAHRLEAGGERDPVAALAWLISARAQRGKFADWFYNGVRNSCTAKLRREAERRACLPIEAEEASP